MKYTGIELLWLFLLYSFFGWALETAAGTIRQKRFVNRASPQGRSALFTAWRQC